MTKTGLSAARQFGSKLPGFPSAEAAEHALYRERDDLLRWLNDLARGSATFRADFSPKSLKDLEPWYFELLEGGAIPSLDVDQETLERAMALYLGEVLVRNAPPFAWFVAEFAFEPGRFEIGVRRPLYQVMLSRLTPRPRRRNRRESSIWRTYLKHAGPQDAR